MFRNLFLTSFLILTFFGLIYPSKEENTKIFDYCYSLEKILSRNVIKTKNLNGKFNSISKDFAKFGTSKTKGALINNMIDRYKISKNSFFIDLFPNSFYCFAGYWIENLKPGTFESIFYEKSKKTINEFRDFKNQIDGFLNDIDSEYKKIKNEFNIILN